MRSKKNSPIVFFALIAVLLSFVSRYATEPTSAAKSTVPAPEERLVIIVNKSNPVSNLSSAELRQIFLGEARSWANGRRVAIVMRDVGQPERDSVLRQIYRMNENDFTRHFLQAVYNGLVPSPPKALATGEGVKKFVFNVP
ncbi:MAG TPA: hypothetical protein VFZ34_19195, partial [Blastocatellia bacterium]|nr:hypothetical protein [Blastocatellia bacterium]